MDSPGFIFVFHLVLGNLVALSLSQNPNYLYSSCIDQRGNYSTNSRYSQNLDEIQLTLSTTVDFSYGFYNLSQGEEPDKVNAIALCRGGFSRDICLSCLNVSSSELITRCDNRKEAIIWYDECMFRYSNRSIYGVLDSEPDFELSNTQNVTNKDEFDQALRSMMDNITSRATLGGDLRKFAVGNASTSDFGYIYGLAQCTPDLTETQCGDCLFSAIGRLPDCCSGKIGGRILQPSCTLMFETFRFFDPNVENLLPPTVLTPPPLSPLPPTTQGKDSNSSTTIIIIMVSVVSVLILAVCIYIYLRRRPKLNDETMDDISWAESLQYDFSTIRIATDNFSDQNKLGQGGFGAVYKGRLVNGQEVAVKRLAIGSGQGDLEFKNEVLLVAKLQHRNLVRLLGYCLAGQERILVYEFVLNTSLDNFIFDPVKRAKLDWESRSNIIRGIGRGLLYLHEDSRLRIIHRDLKASNVLLDAEMNPKIADFGMARLFDQMDETQIYTDRIVGTYGYMAPEFAMHGQFSVKADVYSFGVLVLEIVSGQKNNCCRQGQNAKDLLSLAWRNWREETVPKLFDPTMKMGSRNEMARCVHVALLCVQENVADRPTMGSVLLMLNSTSLSLQLPSQPTLGTSIRTLSDMSSSLNSQTTDSKGSASETLPLSKNEVTITSLRPR